MASQSALISSLTTKTHQAHLHVRETSIWEATNSEDKKLLNTKVIFIDNADLFTIKRGESPRSEGPPGSKKQMRALGQLGYGYHTKKIPFRIIQIWHSFSFTTYHESATNFILLDERNNHYWATADRIEGERLELLICRGLLYYITNFKIIPLHDTSRPIATYKIIIFGKKTTINDCLHGSSVPQFKFNISSWPQIQLRLNSNAVLTDVAGIIINTSAVEFQRNDVKRVIITLLDDRPSEINVALWGKVVTQFLLELKMHRQKNVVLIATGNIILSSTTATDLFFNPNCEEVRPLPDYVTSTYGDFICGVPDPARYTYRMLSTTETTTPYSTIQELLNIRLWIYQKFRCKAIILDILLRGCRHDGSCVRCKHHVSVEVKKYYCAHCGRNYITPTSRPSFVLLVVDRTGNTKFTLQDRELQQLTDHSREELLKGGKVIRGIPAFPQALEKVKGAHCTFELSPKPSSYSNRTGKFMIEEILQFAKHQARSQVI